MKNETATLSDLELQLVVGIGQYGKGYYASTGPSATSTFGRATARTSKIEYGRADGHQGCAEGRHIWEIYYCQDWASLCTLVCTVCGEYGPSSSKGGI